MSNKHVFDCGCSIDIIDGHPQINYTKLNEDCPKAWEIYKKGNTQSIFQLESYLGKKWSKELKPSNIEEAAMLISIIRPGVLQAQDENGTSLTKVLCDRKNNQWEPVDNKIDNLLKKTYGLWCIHEDTYVSMLDGTEKQIKKIVPSDNLISISNNNTQGDTCHGIIESPKTRGVKLTLENGFNIILTNDHKVLTQDGMKEVKDLNQNNDVVAIAINQSICDNKNKSSILNKYNWLSTNKTHIAYLIGQLVGDRCAGRRIASGETKNHKKLFQWLNDNFSIALDIKEFYKIRSNYIYISGKNLVSGKKTKYSLFLERFTLNKTKNNKIIIDEIMTLPPDERRAFIAGLFDSDGHSSKNGCHITSVNPQVLNSVRKLLSIDNIETNITNNRVHICNTRRFNDIIGKYLILKTIYINTYGTSYGSYPRLNIKQHIKSTNNKIKTFCKNNYIPFGCLFKKANFCTINTAKKTGISFGDISFMKIKSIEIINKDLVFYSIAVKNNHNLIGNGIVISNCYQEQVMLVTKELASFDGAQQNKLIKAIGKKQSELLNSLKEEFVTGCKKNNSLTEAEAIIAFENIEKSGRYLFNLSHACGYAKAGYWTAWVKAHLPKHYICAWLRNAKSEQKPLEEIRAVISESRRLQINVMPPSINNLPSTNFFVKNDNVYFGLDSIKGCGEKGLAKLIEADINYADCSWTEFLILYSHLVNKTQMINMIRTGCFDYTTIPRIRLEHEYNQYNLLTKSEKSKCLDIFNTDSDYELSTIVGKFIPFCTAKRLPTVKAIHDSIIEKSNIKDDKLNIISHERELLGINVTCTHISRAEIPDVKDSCAAVSKKKADTELILVGEISDFMEIKIKNPNSKLVGKSMGSFTLTDDRGHTEAIIFPKELEFYQGALYDGNIIMVKCKKSKRDGIIIDKIYEV